MKYLTITIACIGLSLLTACQSTSNTEGTGNVQENEQTQYFAQAKTLLDELASKVEQGKEAKLAYFSPISFKKVLAEYESANEEYTDMVTNGASSLNVFKTKAEQYEEAKQEIMAAITLANEQLNLALANKEITESNLAETFTQDAVLKDIGSPKVFPKSYNKIAGRIADLIEYIDKGKLESAQSKQPSLLIDMRTLEVNTVRENYLGQLDSDIELIEDKDLAIDVPISQQQLLTARENANAIIETTPRATDDIKAAVLMAEFQLAHLYHITKEVNELKGIEIKDYEQYLLTKETLLHSVTEELGTEDLRDLSMTQQVESLALQAGTIQDKLTTVNTALVALQSDNSASSAATESLRNEFQSQLINLNTKYDALVIENSALNKQVQDKDIELIRLQAYKDGVMQVESARKVAVQEQEQAQAKKAAEQKALAEQAQAKKAAEELALIEQEQAKKEAEIIAKETEAEVKTEAEQIIATEQENISEVTEPQSEVVESSKVAETDEELVETKEQLIDTEVEIAPAVEEK